MQAFAQWVGYAVISLSALAGVAFVAQWVMDYMWGVIRNGRNMGELRAALRAYDKERKA